MGTSTSSAGAGSGSPFDPPWLNAAGESVDSGQAGVSISPGSGNGGSESGDGAVGAEEAGAAGDGVAPVTGSPGVAPPARYREARRLLTSFARSGNGADLRRGIGSFVRKGMGGSARAASRMLTTSTAASSLGGLLAAARDGGDPGIRAWAESLKQRRLSANDVALEVVKRLVPGGGSVDEESAKNSMELAISKLYEVVPEVDIFQLTDDQIANVMAYTIAFDVFNRVQLELGRVFEKLRYSARVIQERFGQALDYITTVVEEAMRGARSGATARTMREVASDALKQALFVFGEA